MRATVDDKGRIVVERTGCTYFVQDGRVMREWRDRDDGTIKCRETRSRFADVVRRAIDNYEPRETGDAWSGGFAPNH